MRPLILVDVDGPLNPWAANPKPPRYRPFDVRVGWRRKLRVHLDPRHGAALLELAGELDAELAWATSWMHRANTDIAPRIGLPALKVVEFHDEHGWKYPAVARYGYERPLVWFDDDFGLHPARRDEFVHKRRHLTTALVHVDPATGITERHLGDARRAFSRNL
ncbi:HAD domain-containing protein [Lentzea fradiae]|uniref:HAD domain-containing protein n=1 Tax=Lentzea fradiae TaxID=200378 RepID=UPI00115F87E8|nr:HAD domain-containing protein [Lentzea fradiae]